MNTKNLAILIALLAMLTLTGSECVFVARSGSGSSDSDEEDRNSGLIVVVKQGRFVDAAVEGVHYVSGSLSGTTGPDGEFRYEVNAPIRFYIGDITLGRAVDGKSIITPLDLVPNGTVDTPAVINIARLLLSLDSVPEDGRITIPAALRSAASRANEEISPAIRFLKFDDETVFVNSASQLIATLTAGYPFSAVLVDAQSARAHLIESLADIGIHSRL